MEWNKPFKITNKSGGRLVTGALALADEGEKVIDPNVYSSKAIDSLKIFHARGVIEATNDFKSYSVADGREAVTTEITTTKNSDGDTNKHVVYDPFKAQKAITVEQIDLSAKAISVSTDITSGGKAIEVGNIELDRAEAQEFLSSHWKTVESEISKITSKSKLEFLLTVATEYAVAERKISAIKNRIEEL